MTLGFIAEQCSHLMWSVLDFDSFSSIICLCVFLCFQMTFLDRFLGYASSLLSKLGIQHFKHFPVFS